MDGYLLVLWIAVCIGGIGTWLIWLDHRLERGRDIEKAKWIQESMVPAVQEAMTELLNNGMDTVVKKTEEMTKRMLG